MNSGPHLVRAQRPGKPIRWYIYAWRGGPRIRVAEQVARPRLTRADFEAIDDARAHDVTLPATRCDGAIAAFRAGRYWTALGDSTRRVWGHALDRVEAKWGEVPMRVLADARMTPKIVAWRDGLAEASPRGADIAVTVLDKFFAWAKLQGLAMHNPAAGIPPVYRRADRAPVVWLPADIAAIEKHARQSLRDALHLAALTGLRRTDLVALRWDEVGDFAIVRTAAKRSRGKRYRTTLPRLPDLDALLAELRTRHRKPGVETVLVNHLGKPWTAGGLTSSLDDARTRANGGGGIWHVERDPVTGEELRFAKRLHDFRGTYATALMTHPTARLTDDEIANLMGWSPTHVGEIRKRYVDGAAIVVALGRRLAGAPVKRPVKRRA